MTNKEDENKQPWHSVKLEGCELFENYADQKIHSLRWELDIFSKQVGVNPRYPVENLIISEVNRFPRLKASVRLNGVCIIQAKNYRAARTLVRDAIYQQAPHSFVTTKSSVLPTFAIALKDFFNENAFFKSYCNINYSSVPLSLFCDKFRETYPNLKLTNDQITIALDKMGFIIKKEKGVKVLRGLSMK